MEKIKVAAYCRVSTDKRDQLNSFANQKSYFQREIQKNPHYQLVKIYPDKGISGTKLQRPEFDKMLYDAGLDIQKTSNADNDVRKQFIRYRTVPSSSRKPKFNLILTKNTSRFARNTNVGEILDDLRANKVYVRFLDLNKSTENEADITFIKFFEVIDENDSRDKSSKVRFGQQEGSKHGIIHTSGKLYGYRYIQTENRLEIIPEEAEIIKTIFNLYANGFGIRQILKTLHNSGIKTRHGKDFCKSAISRILSNEKYAGKNNSLKYDTGIVFSKNSYAKVRKKYMIEDSDKIPAIITWDLFLKCKNERLNKINYKNQCGLYKGSSKYMGLIYCGKCGSVYHSNRDNGRKFYNCSRKKSNGLAACNNPNVSQSKIDAFIKKLEDGLAEAHLNKLRVYNFVIINNAILNLFDKFDKTDDSHAKKLAVQIKAKQSLLDGYSDLYAMHPQNRQQLKVKIASLNDEIAELRKQYENETRDKNDIKKEILALDALISDDRVKLNIEHRKYSSEEIISMLDKIIVEPNGKLNAIFKGEERIKALTQKYRTAEYNYRPEICLIGYPRKTLQYIDRRVTGLLHDKVV